MKTKFSNSINPLYTVMCYAAFLAIAVFILSVLPISAKTPNHDDAQSIDFNNRWDAYRATKSPQTVIVGASYAKALQTPFVNLGVGDTNPNEHLTIIKQCRKEDKILYIFTILDVRKAADPQRRFVASRIGHKVRLIKEPSRALTNNPRKQEWEYTPAMCDALTLSLGCPPPRPKITAVHVANMESLEMVSLEPLEMLRAAHPNIIFVLHPTLPLSPIAADVPESRPINHFARLVSDLRQAVIGSGLPLVDLSESASDFRDAFHVADPGALGELLAAVIN